MAVRGDIIARLRHRILESLNSSGLVAGVSAALRASGREPACFPRESMIGALMAHITTPGPGAPQPMNANFGLLPEVAQRRKRDRKGRKAEIALAAVRECSRNLP